MITKEVLASYDLTGSMQAAKTNWFSRTNTNISRLDINSIPLLIDILRENGIRQSDSFLCIDRDNPSSYVLVGNTFNWDLYETLENSLCGEYELYKVGVRLCADIFTYDQNHKKHIKHVEILRLTDKGLALVKDNEQRSIYSAVELALLLCKSPMLTTFPFLRED